jgi:predicted nucleic acid-binding Zn ribbon protein
LKKAESSLASLASELGLDGSLVLYRIKADWVTVFKGPLSQHTSPHGYQNGRLLVLVDSPVWIQQLNFLKSEMLRKLKEYGVKDLWFKLGAVARRHARRPDMPLNPVPEADRAHINEIVSSVKDPELRECIRRAMEKSFSKKRMPGSKEHGDNDHSYRY